MRNVIGRLFAQHRAFLLAVAIVLAAFQFLLCAIVSSLNIEQALAQIMAFAPPLIQVMVEQSMMGGSTAGVLAFGWNHPITHALATAIPIMLGARAIAGEIENGAIELVLAQPISRMRYYAAWVVFALVAMLLVDLAGAAGTLIGQQAFSVHAFPASRLARLVANLLLLQTAIFCATLLLSAFGREAGRVAMAGVLLAVVSFLINSVATLWSKAGFMLPYSLHSYYDPRAVLVRGELGATHIAVLAALSIACAAVAAVQLRTRDLP